jgi:uncharacterized protein
LIVYLDTSALIKLYAEEPGKAQVEQSVSAAETLATSIVTYIETRSAFARKLRMAEIDEAAFDLNRRKFESDWGLFTLLSVDDSVVRRAGGFSEQFGLKAFDALHLASADGLQSSLRTIVKFASFDTALNRAAERLGMDVIATA